MDSNVLNLIAATIVALISSYFGYLKLQKEFAFNKHKEINNYLFDMYINKGLVVIEDYLSQLYLIVITNNITKVKNTIPPFYVFRSMDNRFNTNWLNTIQIIHNLLKDSTKATGKPLPKETEELLEALINEVLFFKRRQELNINASPFKLQYWSYLNMIFKYKNHKKILLLTKNIVHLADSANN